jgi:hypothetical protein
MVADSGFGGSISAYLTCPATAVELSGKAEEFERRPSIRDKRMKDEFVLSPFVFILFPQRRL